MPYIKPKKRTKYEKVLSELVGILKSLPMEASSRQASLWRRLR